VFGNFSSPLAALRCATGIANQLSRRTDRAPEQASAEEAKADLTQGV
jgi:hypothetical protein